MRVLVQRSLASSVKTSDYFSSIDFGMVILVSFTYGDDIKNIDYMVRKLVNLRIFDDDNSIMNKSILNVHGSVLSISQFTLYGDAKKGNRPSYAKALNFDKAKKLYDIFNEKLASFVPVKTGVFGADMLLNIQNDGPVTILLEG